MKHIDLEVSSVTRSTVSYEEIPTTMTTKTVSQRHVSQSHKSNVSTEEVPMTTKKTVSHAHVSPASPAATPDASTPAEVAPQATIPVTAAAAPAPSLPPIDLAPPPANAVIPPVPSDYVPQSGATYRSVSPKKTELLVLAQAVKKVAQQDAFAMRFAR